MDSFLILVCTRIHTYYTRTQHTHSYMYSLCNIPIIIVIKCVIMEKASRTFLLPVKQKIFANAVAKTLLGDGDVDTEDDEDDDDDIDD